MTTSLNDYNYNEEEIRMPWFFPTVLDPCKEQAARFFHCFTTKSEMFNKNVSSPLSYNQIQKITVLHWSVCILWFNISWVCDILLHLWIWCLFFFVVEDVEAGFRAATLCKKEKLEYTTCMEEALQKKQQRTSLPQWPLAIFVCVDFVEQTYQTYQTNMFVFH
jgi:hypothetical protein